MRNNTIYHAVLHVKIPTFHIFQSIDLGVFATKPTVEEAKAYIKRYKWLDTSSINVVFVSENTIRLHWYKGETATAIFNIFPVTVNQWSTIV